MTHLRYYRKIPAASTTKEWQWRKKCFTLLKKYYLTEALCWKIVIAVDFEASSIWKFVFEFSLISKIWISVRARNLPAQKVWEYAWWRCGARSLSDFWKENFPRSFPTEYCTPSQHNCLHSQPLSTEKGINWNQFRARNCPRFLQLYWSLQCSLSKMAWAIILSYFVLDLLFGFEL